MTEDELAELLRAIIAMLEATGIPHMVVGSFAGTTYGEPRSTRDLDVVIDPRPEQLDALVAALDPARFSWAAAPRGVIPRAGRSG